MSVSFEEYPLSEFSLCFQKIFEADEYASLDVESAKIIFSISVNQREFILNQVMCGPFTLPLVTTLSSKLEDTVSKVAALAPAFLRVKTRFKVDIFLKDSSNSYAYGGTSVTIYPTGLSAAPPYLSEPMSVPELMELYELNCKVISKEPLPIFNTNNNFCDDMNGEVYEVHTDNSVCTVL